MTALIVVGAAAALIILLLTVRLHCVAEYAPEGFSLYAKVLFIRIKLIPARMKKEKKEVIVKKEAQKAGSAFKKLIGRIKGREEEVKTSDEILGYVRLAAGALGRLCRSVVIKDLKLHVAIAGNEDAYSAALNHGRLNAAAGAILPTIRNTFRVKNTQVGSHVNFIGTKTEIYIYGDIFISVFAALRLVTGVVFDIRKKIPDRRGKTD